MDYEYSGSDKTGRFGFDGLFGFFSFGFGYWLNVSILIINGRIDIKPLNSPRFTLITGDTVSIIASIVFGFRDDFQIIDIEVWRAFGVTIEKA